MRIGGAAGAKGDRALQRPAGMRHGLDSILLLAVVFCAGILSGCAGLVSGSKTTTGGVAAFQVSPTSVNFGKVGVGKQTTQTVGVTNTGTMPVSITQATTSNPAFSLTGVTLPMTVATGQSGNFTVAVTPSTAGTLSGTLTVQGSDGAAPAVVNLSATAVAPTPQISLSSSSVQFGTVGVGSTSNLSLTISNSGSADLTVSVISLTGSGFSVSGITTPKTISAGQSALVGLSFQPTTAGAATGTLSITSNDPVNPTLTVSLAGTGSSGTFGQLQANPASLSFASVGTGSNATQQVTLSNTGTAPVQISSIAASGAGFSVNGITAPLTLNAAATATLNVVFAPTTGGNATGSVTVTSNANNPSLTISLTGTGAQLGLSITPTSFAFGTVADGQTKSQAFTLTNTGTSSLTISQLSVSGAGYSLSGLTTPKTIAAGTSATFSAVFAPTTAGSLPGTITITSNAPGSPSTVALSGTGVALQASISATPTSANFGSVAVGSTNSQTIQVTNTGNAVLTITQATVTGTGFSTTGLTLPLSINPGLSSTFNAQYHPAAAGAASGSLTIVSNAPTSPSLISLTGTGVAATQILSLSANSVSFGNVNTGASSTQTVTVTNTGNSNVQISQIAASGTGYSLSGAGVPVTLTPSQKLTFSVIFTPTVTGTVSGSVTIASNATGSPATITLSGSGVVPVPHTVSLSWTASTSVVSGYNVYRSTTSGTGYTKLTASLVSVVSYTDSTVVNGTTYYYVTAAVDSSGNESTYSNEAVAVIP
jgi:Abnormal spindle-like microcephaly-assoc'd, ASPM-SPD-2-Hydin/Protein of unknown function (DUF1573)